MSEGVVLSISLLDLSQRHPASELLRSWSVAAEPGTAAVALEDVPQPREGTESIFVACTSLCVVTGILGPNKYKNRS